MDRSKIKKSDKIADEIIKNLDNPSIRPYFPKRYFPKADVDRLVEEATFCNWKSRKGGLVKKTEHIHKSDFKVVYVYKFTLKECGKVSFTMVFDLSNKEPLLQNIEAGRE